MTVLVHAGTCTVVTAMRLETIGVSTGSVATKAVTAETSAKICRITVSVPAITGRIFSVTPTGLNWMSEKEIFRDELREELARNDVEWESRVMEGPAEIQQLLGDFRPFSSHRVLRPFLEAYLLVAEKLASSELGEDVERDRFIGDCMGLGKQYHLQRRIHSAASISQMLFGNALSLAENREPWVVPSWKSSS